MGGVVGINDFGVVPAADLSGGLEALHGLWRLTHITGYAKREEGPVDNLSDTGRRDRRQESGDLPGAGKRQESGDLPGAGKRQESGDLPGAGK